jgi:putative peptide zinc metalloprotease protein
VAEEQIVSLERQIEDFTRQLAMLKLTAPIGGEVVAMPRVEEPPAGVEQIELHGWFGSPLDQGNVGALLEPRTNVLCLAPDDRFQVILLVDQLDRGDMQVGEEVEIRFEQVPGETWTGKVVKIAPRHAEFAPPSLTNKTGGNLATVSDRQGRERLTSSAYEAVVELDTNTARLRSGLRGNSRFYVGHRSTWQWIWRWLRLTFHFRM